MLSMQGRAARRRASGPWGLWVLALAAYLQVVLDIRHVALERVKLPASASQPLYNVVLHLLCTYIHAFVGA